MFLRDPVPLRADLIVRAVAAEVAERSVGFVVLDTLARCTTGVDENAAKDMGRVIANAGTIAERIGGTVLLIHHTGKQASSGARGSSTVRGAVSTELELAQPDGAPPGAGLVVLRNSKQRDGEELRPIPLRLVPVDGTGSCVFVPAGEVVPPPPPESRSVALDVLAAIEPGIGGVTAKQWEVGCIAAGMSKSAYDRAKRNLLSGGRVANLGTKRQPRYRVVTPPDEGPASAEEHDG